MKRNSHSKMVFLSGLVMLSLNTCLIEQAMAEGFPGIGNRNDYADSLPNYNLGNRYLAKQWYEKAIEKYNDAIQIYPHDADVYTNLGIAYRKLGQITEAENTWQKAFELKPDDWMSWSNLANIMMVEERFPEAYQYFKGALKRGAPAEERKAIEANIEGMTKIMRAQGVTVDGKPLPSEVVPSTTSKRSTASGIRSKRHASGTASGIASNPERKVATGTRNSIVRDNPKDRTNAAKRDEIDAAAYDQWLGSPLP